MTHRNAMRTDCIERPISRAFCMYGRFVALHPVWFIVLPLVVAGALGSGLQFVKVEIGTELLFTPERGRAKTERSKIENLFPDISNYNFTGIRIIEEAEIGRLIVMTKDGGDLFDDDVIKEVELLDNITRTISVVTDGRTYGYEDICALLDSKCVPDAVLTLYHDHNIHPRHFDYPVQTIPAPDNGPPIEIYVASSLGGVSHSESGELKANAWQLYYPLRSDHKASVDWQNNFLKVLSQWTFTHISVYRFTTHTVEEGMSENASRVKPLFMASFSILLVFSILSCMSNDWVRSKPWLATLGVVSAGLAVGSGFGLLMHLRVPFNDVVGSGALLVLGIGLDDMFVILAAWRHTDIRLPVEVRMGMAFQEAGLSISITTLTNVLCLSVGALSDLRVIKLFCLYSGVAITFDYLFVLTFFAGCAVVSGKREAAGRHAFFCHKIVPKSQSGHRSAVYRLFCTGGYDQSDKSASVDGRSTTMVAFFRDFLGGALSPRPVKIAVLHIYLVYVGLAVWGVSRIGHGLRMQRLMDDESYARAFVEAEGEYFSHYGPLMQVVVDTPVALWRPSDVDKLKTLLDRFQEPDARQYFYSARHESWLDNFAIFTANKTLNSSTVAQELDTFLSTQAYQYFRLDVGDVIDGRLIRCRLFVRMRDVDIREPSADAMQKARQIADETTDLDVVVYHPSFIIADQFLIIIPSTIQNLAVATAAMFVISLLLIPHPVCAFWVTLSVASVCCGVTGYMSWWGIDLDGIAMVLLLMCVGFSVDFSAHVTYAFVLDDADSGNRRMRNALGALGIPIVQGALSTILGMVVLCASTSYVFRTFFKVIFLVMFFGALHGLVFLPVLLSLFGPSRSPKTPTPSSLVQVAPAAKDRSRLRGSASGVRIQTNPRGRRTPPSITSAAQFSGPNWQIGRPAERYDRQRDRSSSSLKNLIRSTAIGRHHASVTPDGRYYSAGHAPWRGHLPEKPVIISSVLSGRRGNEPHRMLYYP